MYYDTYRGKKRGKRRRRSSGCLGWLLGRLFKLIAFLLVLALIIAGALYALPVALMNVEPAGTDLALTDGLPGDRVNVLLLGLDYLEDGLQRSDAIMIASIGYDGVKLTSVMRDTMVEIPGHGMHKLNSAYSYGGAEMTMRVINETFDLNITNYAAVDLSTMVDLIDALGGVDVSIEEKEIEQVNRYAWNTYKKITASNPTKYLHYADSQPITAPGTYHLNGLFATGYTRIRYTDSDYVRAARQREVLTGLVDSVRTGFYKPQLYAGLYDVLQNSMDTNLSLVELVSLGEKVLISGNIVTHRIPENEHILDDGSAITITNPQGCVQALHAFIYSDDK